jgi:hypothetical protein
MRQGFSAGCSLEVTLKFADFENVKPNFWCGVSEEWEDTEREILTDEELRDRIIEWQTICRKVCEQQVDKDIYDVKQVKLYEQINKRKGGK